MHTPFHMSMCMKFLRVTCGEHIALRPQEVSSSSVRVVVMDSLSTSTFQSLWDSCQKGADSPLLVEMEKYLVDLFKRQQDFQSMVDIVVDVEDAPVCPS